MEAGQGVEVWGLGLVGGGFLEEVGDGEDFDGVAGWAGALVLEVGDEESGLGCGIGGDEAAHAVEGGTVAARGGVAHEA